MAFTRAWSITTPADTDLANTLGSAIRNLRHDLAQRFEIDHEMDDADDGGKHKKVTFLDPLGVKPTAVEDEGYIYTKDVNSKAELHWEDEDGNELALTGAGRLIAPQLLPNDVALEGQETDDTARDLIQVGGDDTIEIGDVNVNLDLLYTTQIRASDGSTLFPLFSYGGVTMAPGYIDGLKLGHDTDADVDITISQGVAMDNTSNHQMVLVSSFVKRFDELWSAGTPNGGLASGVAWAIDTLYYVFLIMHTDGTVDVGMDTSNVATALLADSGYTYFRQIGWLTSGDPVSVAGNLAERKGVVDSYIESDGPGVVAEGSTVWAHGLGRTPRQVEMWLRCISADGGYSAGDIISAPDGGSKLDGSTNGGWVINLQLDATNLIIRLTDTTTSMECVQEDGSGFFSLTYSKWSWFVRLWT